jgi:(p)ppGpp synthase/HD superfamily hydrolase
VTAAWERARTLPRPDSPDLVEALVTADPDTAAILLAEWLDQLRHVRLWAPEDRVEEAHRLTREVYLPVAERGHETMARRFGWWLRRVAGG